MKRFLYGFTAIQNAIYFRLTLENDIDKCAFFSSLSTGWYHMYDEDENILELWGDK